MNQYKQLEDLLTWSKMQLGQFALKPASLNLKEVANDNLEVLKSFYLQKNIKVYNYIADIWILEDRTLLNSIFQNLLTNAIKFTPASGTITLNYRNADDYTEVMIEDTGTGISEEHLNKLFTLSTHFSLAGTDGEKGSGLGLLICKDMVARMGGKLTVKSKYGDGSTFIFSIPAEKVSCFYAGGGKI